MAVHICNTSTCNAEALGLGIRSQGYKKKKKSLELYLRGRCYSVGIVLGLTYTGHPTPATHTQGRVE